MTSESRHRGVYAAVLAGILVILLCSTANGAEEQEIRQWIDEQISKASKLGEFPFAIEWEDEKVYSPPLQTIQRFEAETKNKPDHPVGPIIPYWKKRLEGKYDTQRCMLWIGSLEMYRQHFVHIDGVMTDKARSDDESWDWNGNVLNLYTPGKYPPGTGTLESTSTFKTQCANFIWTGMTLMDSTSATTRYTLKRGQTEGEWTVQWTYVERSPKPSVQLDFVWDEETSAARVTRLVIRGAVDMQDPTRWGLASDYRFSSAEYNKDFGVWI